MKTKAVAMKQIKAPDMFFPHYVFDRNSFSTTSTSYYMC